MLNTIEFGPLIAFASCTAARRLHVPALVAQIPLPIEVSGRSLSVSTTNCWPVPGTAAAWIDGTAVVVAPPLGAVATVGSVGDATAWRSETSTQPSPLTSAPGSAEQTPPTSRACIHASETMETSADVTDPSPVTSRARFGPAVGAFGVVTGLSESTKSPAGAAIGIAPEATTTAR